MEPLRGPIQALTSCDVATKGVVEIEGSRWRSTPGTVFGLLALVIAVAGTAIAGPLATKSVLSKKERNEVRKIAKRQINALAPGLAVASAGKANSAGTAGTAGNANLLDGLDASAFARADRVRNSGRVVVNDPTPSDNGLELAILFAAGPFTIQAWCAEDFGGGSNEIAQLQVIGPSGSSFAGPSGGSGPHVPNGFYGDVVFLDTAANSVEGGHVTAVAPGGQVVSVAGSAETNDPAGNCVFAATAIGP